MAQDSNCTFVKALRTVFITTMLLLTGIVAMAEDDTPKGVVVKGNVYGGGNQADVKGNAEVNMSTGTVEGNVFGGGKGKADNFTCDKAMVGENNKGETETNYAYGNTAVTITNGTVEGDVYGGGEVGRVEMNTEVTIGAADNTATVKPIIKGHVFGAGQGLETHGYSALVRGNATVTILGKAEVWKNVHGGGEKASVGRYQVAITQELANQYHVRIGMPCYLKAGGKCTVNIQDEAKIGKDADTGEVYGAGQGITPAYNNTPNAENRSKRMVTYTSDTDYPEGDKGDTWDYYENYPEDYFGTKYVWEYFADNKAYLQYVETLARASETDVVIGGKRDATTGNIIESSNAPTVNGSVYGGSESGFVYYSTEVNIKKGTIDGDVFGGGKGLASFSEAGRVRRNTNLTVSDGTIKGNVYGGGSYGDVGYITKDLSSYNYAWTQTDGSTANEACNNRITGTNNNTGICNVTIEGGEIGLASTDKPEKHGNVFGAGRGLDDTWWCEKAMAFATNVTVSAGTVYGTVYGGGEVGRVEDDAKVTIGVANQTEGTAPVIMGSVFGAGAGLQTHGYSALLRGNSDVTVQGTAQVGGSVYGGGETASVGRFHVVKGLPTKPESGGYCTVTIQDKAKIGSAGTGHDVFGACKGVTPAYDASDYKSVYSMQTYENRPSGTEGDTWDYYTSYPEGYAGQKFIKRYYKTEADYLAFLKTLALTSHPHVTIAEEAEVLGSVYGGGKRGVTLGKVDVDVTGGTISQDVYGGGALADTNLGNWDEQGYVVATALNTGELITDLYTRTGSGTAESPYSYTKITDPATDINSGTYYRQQATWAHDTKSAYYITKVNILGGTIGGDAYGGGLGQLEAKTGETVTAPAIEAKVYGDVYVNLNGFNKDEVTYDANIHGATGDGARLETDGDDYLVKDAVKGAIVSHIFGCNNLNGSPQGKVKVHVYKTQRSGETRITNDTNTTTAKQLGTKDANGEYDLSSFDVKAVYGGGNMAAYVPVDLTTSTTQVVIDGCERTSIGQVYGGGNAASTPATEVTVNGTFEIGEVFGGGNGKDKITINDVSKDNPGANVGFYDYSAEEDKYDTKEKRTATTGEYSDFISKYVYGTGRASVNIYGGTIHRVFGGSNTKGNVRQTAVTLLEETGGCEFCMDEAYGGGKSAPMDAEAKLLMACIPGLNAAYGGAEAADIMGDVTLSITNGTFERVFGGNNLRGTIRGSIEVNIEEIGCRPIIIGELYGGGNQAGYSIYGYKQVTEGTGDNAKKVWKPRESATDTGEITDALTTPYNHPKVNVKSFTSIGNIYGGGYGVDAVMVGNPTVNINVTEGKWIDRTQADMSSTASDYGDYDANGYKGNPNKMIDGHNVIIPPHKAGKIGAIQNVFGGGNAAEVQGSTNVNIGIKKFVEIVSVAEGTDVRRYYTRSGEGTITSPYEYEVTKALAEAGKTYYSFDSSTQEYTAVADIVVGETNVSNYYTRSGENTTESPYVYTLVPVLAAASTTYYMPVLGADIKGDVYGGGNQAKVTGSTNVIIGKDNTTTP